MTSTKHLSNIYIFFISLIYFFFFFTYCSNPCLQVALAYVTKHYHRCICQVSGLISPSLQSKSLFLFFHVAVAPHSTICASQLFLLFPWFLSFIFSSFSPLSLPACSVLLAFTHASTFRFIPVLSILSVGLVCLVCSPLPSECCGFCLTRTHQSTDCPSRCWLSSSSLVLVIGLHLGSDCCVGLSACAWSLPAVDLATDLPCLCCCSSGYDLLACLSLLRIAPSWVGLVPDGSSSFISNKVLHFSNLTAWSAITMAACDDLPLAEHIPQTAKYINWQIM